jgi:hypothetical protein
VDRQLELARQVGHDHDRALQHAHEEQLLPRVVPLDLAAHLGDAAVDLVLGVEDLGQVVGDVGGSHVTLPSSWR